MRYINRQHNSAILLGVTPLLNNNMYNDYLRSCPWDLGNAEPKFHALITRKQLFLAYPTYSYGGPRYKAPKAGYRSRPKCRTSHGTKRHDHHNS